MRQNADYAYRPVDEGMIWIPSGTFRVGSDKHYPEEAPVHRVTVSGFWIDPTPVTSRAFGEFVEATGYVTFAELTPDPKDCAPNIADATGRLHDMRNRSTRP